MATVFSTATLGLNVDVKQFQRDLSGTQKLTVKALEEMQSQANAFDKRWREMTGGIKDTKRVVSGILISQGFYAIMNALTGAASAALEFSSAMEKASISLEYFVDSAAGTEEAAAKVAAYLREVNEFAARTPFNTDQVLSLSKYMQSVGVAIGQTQSVLTVLTDAAAATGATSDNLERIVFALGQMLTKGRIANEEIRQLANANIPIYDILQEELGLTGSQVSRIGKYWVDADKAVVAILNGLEKRYQGAADRIAETFAGMTDTIIDDAKIIARDAFDPLYNKLLESTRTLRDTLDSWRTIITEKGTPGLFNDIVLNIDPSGQLGNMILSMIGNVRQLKKAFLDLYHAAAPVLSVVGKSFAASLNVGMIALTALAKTVNGVIDALNKMGITTGVVGKGIASLFIAYKATQFVSLLGQALAHAAVAGQQAAAGLLAILPASMSANAGVVALTASVATLVAYLLTAASIFGVLNNNFAGLSSENGPSGLNNNWQTAYDTYLEQLEAYNAAVDSYRAKYEESYKNMGDPSKVSVGKGTDDDKDKSKSSKDTKKEWVAAFDEVYDVPDKDKPTGSQLDGILEDFTDLIDLLEANFPFPSSIDLPEKPTFNFGNVYGDSIWDDSGAADADFWRHMLPGAATGLVLGLGKAFAKQQAIAPKRVDTGLELKKGVIDVFADEAPILKQLDNMQELTEAHLKKLRNTAEQLEVALHSRRFAGSLDSIDEVKRLGAILDEQLDAIRKEQEQLTELASLANKSVPTIAESDALIRRANMLLAESLQTEKSQLEKLLTKQDLTYGEAAEITGRISVIDKHLKQLQSGALSMDISALTPEELAKVLTDQAEKVTEAFDAAFSGPLKQLADGTRVYNMLLVEQATKEYKALVELADAIKSRSAVLTDAIENTFGVKFMRMFDLQRGDIEKRLAIISKYGVSRNVSGGLIDTAHRVGVSAEVIDQQNKIVKSVEDADNYLRGIARDMSKLNPEAIAEVNAAAIGRSIESSLRSGINKIADANDAVSKNVADAKAMAEAIRRQNALNASDIRASILRAEADLNVATLRPIADIQADIREQNKLIRAADRRLTTLQEQLSSATEGSPRYIRLSDDIAGATLDLKGLRYALDEYTKELADALGSSSIVQLKTVPDIARDTLEGYERFVAAIEKATPHLRGLDDGVEAVRATLNSRLSPELAKALSALDMTADELVATGTKFLVLSNGIDAFTGSIPMLTDRIFGSLLKLTGSSGAAESAFTKMTAALGVALEPIMRMSLSIDAMERLGVVHGTGHAAVPNKPIIVQNDASIALYESLNSTTNGAVKTLDEIGVDFKVTAGSVVDILNQEQFLLDEVNGIKVISANALLAANKPSWYYEFIPHLEAFGANNRKELISILNRDFDFRQFGTVISQNVENALMRGNTRTDLVSKLEGRYISTDAVELYRSLRGDLLKGLDEETLTKLYFEEVIRPAFTDLQGTFDTKNFRKMMSEFIVDYSGVDVKAITGLADYFYTMNEVTALLVANKQVPGDLSKAYFSVVRDGQKVFSEMDFAPVLRYYNDFSRSITGWFENILGKGALDDVYTHGLFTDAPVRRQIDALVRNYNSAIRAGEDATEVAKAFRENMQKISNTARTLAASAAVPTELDGKFLKAGQDITKFKEALGKLAEATELLAEAPALTSELPRIIRTTVDTATRLNFQIENGIAVAARDVSTLARGYKRLVEMLHLQTDVEAYRMGQQIEALNELMKAEGDATRVLSSAEAFKIELPIHIANIQEHVSIWGRKLLADIEEGVIQVSEDVEKEIRAMLAGISTDIKYTPLDATLRAAKNALPTAMSFVDIEAPGFKIQTATGAIQPPPAQISAINPAGEQRTWLVNWGEKNEEILNYMRSINEDFAKAFENVTVDMMDAADDIDTVMREVYEFTQADHVMLSGYNAANIGGYDLDILNAWMPDGKTFLPGVDVMRRFNEEVNNFLQFGKNIQLADAYEIAVGTLDETAHLAENDIAMTYEVWKRIQDGTVAKIAAAAADISEVDSALDKLKLAANNMRSSAASDAAEVLTRNVEEVVEDVRKIAYPLETLDPGTARVIKATLGSRITNIEGLVNTINEQLPRYMSAIEQVGDPKIAAAMLETAQRLTTQRDELVASLDLLRQQYRIASIGEMSIPAREHFVEGILGDLRKSGTANFLGETVNLRATEMGAEVTHGTFKYQAATLDDALDYAENYFKGITGLAVDTMEGFSESAHIADAAADVISDATYAATRAADRWNMLNYFVKQMGEAPLGKNALDDAAKILFTGTNDLLEGIPDSFLKTIYGVDDEVIDTFRRIADGTADEVLELFEGVEDVVAGPSAISKFMSKARSFGETAYEKFFKYLGFGFSNTKRLNLKAVPELMDAIKDYSKAFGETHVAAMKADKALTAWKAVPDQGSDLAKSLKQVYEAANDELKAASASLDDFRTRFFNSLIIKTREGLRSAQALDFDSLGKILSSGSNKVAYYIDKATGEWKLISNSITTDGEGLLKSYAKLAEAGTFGEKVAKEVSDAMGDLQEVLKSGENIHTAMGRLSDAVKDSFADFQKGAVIYDVADDAYYAGSYAAKQVKRAAAAIDKSFESFGWKLLKFNIATYSLFDIADIAITGNRQREQDIKNESLAGMYVESLLSDEVTELIKAAGLNTGELVADNIYEGVAQAVGQSIFVNGIINVLMLALSGVVTGIPGLIFGGLSAVGTALGLNTLFGTDEYSKAVNSWSSMLAGREHSGIFGMGVAKPYDTTEFERLLRETGSYTDQEIADLVVGARITDTASLISALKDNYAAMGQYGQGNIDLYNRPVYKNADGSISTVDSITITADDLQYVIPTIAYDAKGKPVHLTDAEAVARFEETGEYLGAFTSLAEADEYAQLLHKQQDAAYNALGIAYEDLAGIAELVSTNSLYQAFRFATQTPTDDVRGYSAYKNILYGRGYTPDMYVDVNGGGYSLGDRLDPDITRSLNSLRMSSGSEEFAAVRIAAAMGAINATSIAQQHQSSGASSWVASEMVVPLESAADDLDIIKKILGEDYAGLQLGEQIAVNGKEYVRVLDATGKAVRYFGDDTEALRAMIQAVYTGGAQEGEFTETLRGIIAGNDYLKQALVDNMGYDARAITAYDNIKNYLAILAESDSSYAGITGETLDENPGMAAALMKQQLDIWDAYEQAKLTELGISTATQSAVGGNSDVLAGNTAQVLAAATLEGLTPTMLAQLAASGITLSSGSQAYETALQGSTALDYITVGTDQEALLEALRGVTVDVSGMTIDLDGKSFDVGALSVTTDEASILAEAGIQFNSNGTVSFMYNHNEERTGSERTIDLSKEYFSEALLDQLGTHDMVLDFDASKLEFNNFDKVKQKMSAAFFKMSDNINGMLSDPIRKVFAKLGTVTEDGFFKITNAAILSGNKALTEALNELDWYGVADVVKDQFYNIAKLVDSEGSSVQDNIIEWANAVSIPSPIDEGQLTDDIKKAFRGIGVNFVGAGEELQMIISNTGEKLSNGFTLISKDKWDSLSKETRKALDDLKVKTIDAGNQLIVDLTHVMEEGAGEVVSVFVDKPELWEQLPDTVKQYLEETGIIADEQLLEINRKLGTWLVETTDGWIASWESLDQPTKDALSKLGLTVDDGMVAIAGYVEGAELPETIDREALVPFSELPTAVQDALKQVDKNCETKMYDIRTTAATGFTKLNSVLGQIVGVVANTAQEMVTGIAEAIDKAMTSMDTLKEWREDAGKTGSFFGLGGTKNPVVKLGWDAAGNLYGAEYDSSGNPVKYMKRDAKTGVTTEISSPPSGLRAYATGGTVDSAASSLPILAGELGKEMAIMPNGSTKLLDAGLYNLPTGTQILNADDTKMVQKYAGSRPTVKAFAEGTASLSMSTAEGYEYGEYDNSLIDYLDADSSLRETRNNERSSQMQYFLAEEFELAFSRLDLLRAEVEESTEHMAALVDIALDKLGATVDDVGKTLSESILSIGDSKETENPERYLGYNWEDVVAAAKVGWANATTDEEREAWHNLAEMARATQGISGGADGSAQEALSAPMGSIAETVQTMLNLMTKNSSSVDNYNWVNVVQAAQEGYKKAVSDEEREAWHAVAEMARNSQGFSGGASGTAYELLPEEQAQTASLAEAVQTLQALQLWSEKPIETVDGLSWQDVTNAAKLGWSVATTDEERALWHDLAEEARATQGFLGGPAGTAVNYLGRMQGSLAEVVYKLQALQSRFGHINWGSVKGSAHGSVINSEGLYKLGEGGLSEAIIPLERPDVLYRVGAALASFMPESAEGLRAALGLANGGIVTPGPTHSTQHETTNLIDAVTRGVLERVLPAIATAQQGAEETDGRTPIYVGTLVASDSGLRELERKLYVIRQAETMRRG